jgi:hypothetical protein
MTEQEKAELKDQIIKHIGSEEKDCHKLSIMLDVDFDLIWTLTDEMDLDGYVKARDYFTKNRRGKGLKLTPKGITFARTSSYFSLFKSERSLHTRQKTNNKLNVMFKLIAAIGVIWSIVFTCLTYMKSNEIDDLKARNNSLIEQVESLKKEVKRTHSID